MLTTFSPEKVLYRYQDIVNFLNTGEIFTPTSIDIDVSGVCNNSCYFCNAKRSHNNKFLSLKQLEIIIGQARKLGISHCCIAGGGEPFCNPYYSSIDEYLNKQGFNKLLTTNGYLLSKVIDTIYNYDSIGVSFDCLTNDDYIYTRKNSDYDELLKGIERLHKHKKEHDIRDTTCKTLITKFNYNKLYGIAKYAKDIGFNAIYIRPAGLHNIKDKNKVLDLSDYKLTKVEVHVANKEIEKALELKDKTFNVFYSNPFYEDITTPKYEFKNCIACMLNLTFCTDGYIYLCMEQRGNPRFRLCKHQDWLKYWNSNFHKEKILNITYEDCPRCAKNEINKIIEEGIINNKYNRYYI